MKIYKVKVNGKVYEVELQSVEEVKENTKASEISKPIETKSINKEVQNSIDKVDGLVLKAPMQGTIIKINKEVGMQVKKGETVMVLETMKLENDIVSPATGIISSIKVKKGQDVGNQEELLVIG